MPDFLKDAIKRGYKKKGVSDKKATSIAFATMNKMGAVHGSAMTPLGRAMQRKHDRDMKGQR